MTDNDSLHNPLLDKFLSNFNNLQNYNFLIFLRRIKDFIPILYSLNKLEEFRKMAKLTQEELSVKAEVSRKSINAIENGVYVPSTVLALKISKTLNCNVEDLFKLPED